MEIPHLIKVETISDVLDLLGDQTKLGKRLADLSALESHVQQLLKRYTDINDIEQYLKAAQAKMREANQRDAETKNIVADARSQGECILEEAKAKAAEVLKAAEERSNQLHAIASRQDLKERELVSRETSARESMQESSAQMDKAKALMAKAEKMIAEYQTRLGKLKELAA